jgi:hypothetical protein
MEKEWNSSELTMRVLYCRKERVREGNLRISRKVGMLLFP